MKNTHNILKNLESGVKNIRIATSRVAAATALATLVACGGGDGTPTPVAAATPTPTVPTTPSSVPDPVTTVNHIPTANPTLSLGTVGISTIRIDDILAASGASDADGDILIPTTDNPRQCEIINVKMLQFRAQSAYIGEGVCNVTLSDGNGGSVVVRVVANVNSIPSIDSTVVYPDNVGNGLVIFDPIAIANGKNILAAVAGTFTATGGTVVFDGGQGIARFTPAANYQGAGSISYQVAGLPLPGTQNVSTYPVTITLNGINTVVIPTGPVLADVGPLLDHGGNPISFNLGALAGLPAGSQVIGVTGFPTVDDWNTPTNLICSTAGVCTTIYDLGSAAIPGFIGDKKTFPVNVEVRVPGFTTTLIRPANIIIENEA